jgi:hypothetical protein
MPQRLAGIVAKSDELEIVILDWDDGEFTFDSAPKIKLQNGKRPSAYKVLHQQVGNRLREMGVNCAYIFASATSGRGMGKGHLLGAELRGVAMAAAASVCDVEMVDKGATSRSRTRKVGDYVKDDSFWKEKGLVEVPKGMRDAAFAVIAKLSKE